MKKKSFPVRLLVFMLTAAFAAASFGQISSEMTWAEQMRAACAQKYLSGQTEACFEQTCCRTEDFFSEIAKREHFDFQKNRLHPFYETETSRQPASPKVQSGSWESIGPEGGWIETILQHPENGNILYAAPHGYPCRIHKSTDSGSSWTELSVISSYVSGLAMDAGNAESMYTFGNYYIGKSTDGGGTWDHVYVPNTVLYGGTVDSSDPDIIHAYGQHHDGTDWRTAYLKSTDGGDTWSAHYPLSSTGYSYPYCMKTDPGNSDILYIGGYYNAGSSWSGFIFRSTDGGSSWHDITSGTSGWIYDIAVDPVSGKIYAVTGSAVYRSTDRGDSWQQNSGWAWGRRLAIDPANPNTVYAGGWDNCLKSTDGGMTWNNYSSGLYGGSCHTLLVDHSGSGRVFLGSSAGFFKSEDGGMNWLPSNTGILLANITAVRTVPSSPKTVFAAFYNNALYKTADASAKTVTASGVIWDRMPSFYACHNLSDLIIDPQNPDRMAAMEGGG